MKVRINSLRIASVILLLAGIAGLLGVPVLAIALSVAGLLLIDAILIGGLWRVIFRNPRD